MSRNRINALWPQLLGLPLSSTRMVIIVALAAGAGLLQAGLLLLLVKLAVSAIGGTSLDLPVLNLYWDTTRVSLLGLLGVASIVGLELGASHLLAKTAAETYTDVRRCCLHAYLEAKWEVQAGDAEGHLQELLTSQAQRAATAVVSLLAGTIAAVNFVVLSLAAFAVDWEAALLAIAAVLLLLGISRPLIRWARSQSAVQTKANLELSEAIAESVGNAREIRLFGVAKQVEERLAALIRRSSQAYYRNRLLFRLAPVLFRAGAAAIAIATILLVTNTTIGNLDSVGAAVLILLRALGYAQGVQTAYHQLGEASPWLESLDGKLAFYERNPEEPGTEPIRGFGEIVFDKVTFSYPGSTHPALQSVSFKIARGETVGIVGPSGGGKTTLLQILLQMYEPTGGKVLVDGRNLFSISRRKWRSMLAFVPQESRLARGTVNEAIRFHRTGYMPESVVRAVRAARAHEFVSRLPLGYDSPIGPRSEGFSGGQRQRLSIARALLGRPEILVLDEPTSALDQESESALSETLRSLKGSMTLVIVSHRPQPLSVCDRFLVLEEGILNETHRLPTLPPSESISTPS